MADSERQRTQKSYFESLDDASRARYIAKTTIIEKLDPYSLDSKRFSSDPKFLPAVSNTDIILYLLYSQSPYTLEDLRCYKGLDAYNQFVNGWVRDVKATVINGNHLIIGRVLHSQRLSDTPLRPWIIAEKSGKIVCCHCDCVAGLGETCTHVCALLFYVETKARIRDSATVTETAAYWKLPTSIGGASYLPVNEIDFTSAKTKKKQIDTVGESVSVTPGKRQIKSVETPTQQDVSSLFRQLSINGSKAAVLRIVPEYCKDFKPLTATSVYPPILTDLYSADFVNISYSDLLEKSVDVFSEIKVSEDEAKSVEKATRSQAKSKLWHRFRAGRITASQMKRACKSNPEKPSESLGKRICYPEATSFSTVATEWGCKHENTAKSSYKQQMQDNHENFCVEASGFVINPKYPHIGATPDAIASCDCCGKGAVEIKCPYSARDCTVSEYARNAKSSCLEENEDEISLEKDHDYMYQVQTQMHVCEVDYIDFVVWTNCDIHVERIESNGEMWHGMLNSASKFMQKCVIPELVGKYYSKSGIPTQSNITSDQSQTSSSASSCNQSAAFCYCGGPEEDTMIACDDGNCKIEWFHLKCLKLKRVPKGNWFCPDCRDPQRQPKKRTKKS